MLWLQRMLRSGEPPRRLAALGEGIDARDHLLIVRLQALARRIAEVRRDHDVVELAERVV